MGRSLRHCTGGSDQPREHIKKQRHYFANKGPSDQGFGFTSGHVWMWELDCEESWAPKNWCFWIVVLEKIFESPLGCKEIQPVHFKGNQSWVFFGRTDAKAETPILWPLDAKNWLIGKDLDDGRDRGQEEKGTAEDEITGWHHNSMDMSLGELQELVIDREAWRAVIYGVAKSWTRLNNWTELIFVTVLSIFCYVWYFYWNTGNLVKPPFCFIYPSFPFAEDDAPIPWAPDVKSSLIGKDPAAEKNWV